MNNGSDPGKNFTHLLTDKSETDKLNPVWEVVKSIFGKSDHTVPALFLAFGERAPVINTEKLIQMGKDLKDEFQQMFGLYFKKLI